MYFELSAFANCYINLQKSLPVCVCVCVCVDYLGKVTDTHVPEMKGTLLKNKEKLHWGLKARSDCQP